MKKSTALLTFLYLIIYIFAQTSLKPLGKGTINDPFRISSLENLCWINDRNFSDSITFNDKMSKHYIQTADISFPENIKSWDNGQGWMPIGYHTDYKKSYNFKGTYDGKGHTISNLFINRPYLNCVGLFYHFYADYNNELPEVKIQNLGLIDVDITGKSHVGSLVGNAEASYIDKCYATGIVKSSNVAGGLIGCFGIMDNFVNERVTIAQISNCFFKGSVTANSIVGGITAYAAKIKIINCYSISELNSHQSNAGGIIGLYYSSDNSLFNSYFNGTINCSTEQKEGFDTFTKVTIKNTFWNSDLSPLFSALNLSEYENVTSTNLKALSINEMKNDSTFIKSGWDFKNTWQINKNINDGYPSFVWQKK